MGTNNDKEPSPLHNSETAVAKCSRTKTDDMILLLDAVDMGVEQCRREAIELEEKLENLTYSLDVITTDTQAEDISAPHREELECYINRITTRLQSVEIKVSTARSPFQVEALHTVNLCIGKMIEMKNPRDSLQCCQIYLNSCSSNQPDEYAGSSADDAELDLHTVDKSFENSLLGCTLDDQKRIKKRLGNLKRYITEKVAKQADPPSSLN